MIDLDAADLGLGWHPKEGFSKDFATNSDVWMWATVNNAVYIFRKQLCPRFNIPTPNIKLHIFASNGKPKDWSGCAPMCRHVKIRMADWQLYLSMVYGLAAQSTFDILGPDVMIFNSDKTDKTEAIYATVFHEMSHVCHYCQVGKDYWEKYVTFIISNFGYGKRYDENYGYVGIGEIWGYFFGNYVCADNILNDARGWNAWKEWFNPGIIKQIYQTTPLTYRQIFDCFTSDVTDYDLLKQKLISKYGYQATIKQCFSDYGF